MIERFFSGKLSGKAACMSVGIVSLWYINRPYRGIVHDSVIYIGRALASLHPSTVGTQLSYVNDGQSKFSLFPLVMTWAVHALGPGSAALVATAIGLALWLAVAVFLFSRLLLSIGNAPQPWSPCVRD